MFLDVANLTKKFGSKAAVDGISFTADSGERIALVGRNGAGKTTLLRMLATYLPPTTGTVVANGFDLFLQAGAIRTITGYLPEGAPIDPELRVAEYLRFRGHLRRMPRPHLRARMHDVVDFCELAPLRSSRIGTLSYGQRQRVALADAILHEPDILLFDDPLAGCDPVQAEKFTAMMSAPAVTDGRLLLFSAHSADLVRRIATRILFLDRGRIVRDVKAGPELAGRSLSELFDVWTAASAKEAHA